MKEAAMLIKDGELLSHQHRANGVINKAPGSLETICYYWSDRMCLGSRKGKQSLRREVPTFSIFGTCFTNFNTIKWRWPHQYGHNETPQWEIWSNEESTQFVTRGHLKESACLIGLIKLRSWMRLSLYHGHRGRLGTWRPDPARSSRAQARPSQRELQGA